MEHGVRRVDNLTGSDIFLDNRPTDYLRIALWIGLSLPPGIFMVLIPVRDWVDPGAIVQLEVLGKRKDPVTLSGIEPATYRLLA
jgi:hypothetical protein